MPVGIQDFEKLREEGFVYVDKTALVYKLTRTSCPYFFSRPRRFGKSLLISTLEAYFLGKKHVFEGLAIAALETEWAEYPVLHFDFNGQNYSDPNGLTEIFAAHFRDWEKQYGIQKQSDSLGVRFADVIKSAHEQTGRKVVVLIDEYDKPLLETLSLKEEQIEENRAIFKGVFGQLKRMDAYLRFVLFTGVTKFSKVSIFSDLNQLQDITMHEDYAELCGITQQELESNFAPEIDSLATDNGLSHEECIAKLKQLYDGYHFTERSPDIYNPFSLINAFSNRKFGKYWFGTGTPTFLVKKINELGFNPQNFSDGSILISESEISDYRPDNPDIVPLLYQSGYLTVKGYEQDLDSFVLGYPNDEVKYGFTTSLTPLYLHADRPLEIRNFVRDIKSADTDSLRDRFVSLFANLPYANASDKILERDFQNVIYLVFLLLGQFAQVEQHSAKGRADCIVKTDHFVYIFEFKRDSSADDALSQIETQGYAKPFETSGREIIKIGVNFSSEEKNIIEWKAVRS